MRPLAHRVVQVTLIHGLARGSSLLIPMMVAAWYGASRHTDAFFLALTLVMTLANFLTAVMESVLVPELARRRGDRVRLRALLASIGARLLAGSALAAAGLWWFAPSFFARAARLDPAAAESARSFLVVLLPLPALVGFAGLAEATLLALQRYIPPAVVWLFRTAVVLGTLAVLRFPLGVLALPVTYLGGELARMIALQVLVRPASGGWPRWTWRAAPDMDQLFRSTGFLGVGLLVLNINPLLDHTMAAWLGPGQVSILSYAERCWTPVLALATGGLTTVLLSHWSQQFGGETASPPPGFDRQVLRVAVRASVVAAAVSAGLWLLGDPLLAWVFGRGEFPLERLAQLQTVFRAYVIALAPLTWGFVYARAHLVLRRTDILLVLSMLNVLCHLAFNLAFIRPLGIAGLALSSALVAVVIDLSFVITLGRAVAVRRA